MRRGRLTAVATGLLLAASVATAGCGLGPGEDLGDVALVVTRDFGTRPVVPASTDSVTEADTVMRVLEREADVQTRYGGGFVQSIEGLAGESNGAAGPLDWFYFVDGVEAGVGAADYDLKGGESIWWDYRDWSASIHVPAVVGSWPAPFAEGYEGRPHPIAVECRDGGSACGLVRKRVAATGGRLVESAVPSDAIRVLVGPWSKVRTDPTAARLEKGPEASGVYVGAASGGMGLVPLDESGDSAGAPLGRDAGLVAATRHLEDPPVWVVTGGDAAGVLAAAGLLDEKSLHDRYALATEGDAPMPLPVR